ncbi:hypothetical protein THAOC_07425, partial [Thalassiosira oceanica]
MPVPPNVYEISLAPRPCSFAAQPKRVERSNCKPPPPSTVPIALIALIAKADTERAPTRRRSKQSVRLRSGQAAARRRARPKRERDNNVRDGAARAVPRRPRPAPGAGVRP